MFFVWALALTGLFLLVLEFYLPGGIMAIGASVLFLSSLFVFHRMVDGAGPLLLYAVALGGAAFAIVRAAQSRLEKRDSPRSADPIEAVLYSREWVGKRGFAATDLNPQGKISIDDRTYEAKSESGRIEKGTPVLILEGKGSLLIVKTSTES